MESGEQTQVQAAALTRQELRDEFWLLTVGILQDSRVETREAKVVKRWLEVHPYAGDFTALIAKLDGFLNDGFIDRFESAKIIDMIGHVLRELNVAQGAV